MFFRGNQNTLVNGVTLGYSLAPGDYLYITKVDWMTSRISKAWDI